MASPLSSENPPAGAHFQPPNTTLQPKNRKDVFPFQRPGRCLPEAIRKQKKGKNGYQLACRNEWLRGVNVCVFAGIRQRRFFSHPPKIWILIVKRDILSFPVHLT